MKFYSRKKEYEYGTRLVFFWKYKAKDGRWWQRQVYWGNRETDAIVNQYGCIKNIAQLSDGLERRDLIRRTPWLNRGKEDYSDEHFSQSIYLRLQELKKQTPKLPKPEFYPRLGHGRGITVVTDAGQLAKMGLTNEQREQIREIVKRISTFRELFGKVEEESYKQVVKKANQIREFGEKLELLTGKKRFWKRDFVQFQSSFPAGVTCRHCQLAMSTWRVNPKPIDNECQAREIVAKKIKLDNEERHRRNLEAQARRAKALRKRAIAAAISPKSGQHLVPTIQVAANSSKPQFYWDFFE